MMWPNGGMVDATDLKSVIRNGCEGSNPSSATICQGSSVEERRPVGSQKPTVTTTNTRLILSVEKNVACYRCAGVWEIG